MNYNSGENDLEPSNNILDTFGFLYGNNKILGSNSSEQEQNSSESNFSSKLSTQSSSYSLSSESYENENFLLEKISRRNENNLGECSRNLNEFIQNTPNNLSNERKGGITMDYFNSPKNCQFTFNEDANYLALYTSFDPFSAGKFSSCCKIDSNRCSDKRAEDL